MSTNNMCSSIRSKGTCQGLLRWRDILCAQAVGRQSEAEGFLHEARQLVQLLQADRSSLAKPRQDKLKALQAFLGIPDSTATNGH